MRADRVPPKASMTLCLRATCLIVCGVLAGVLAGYPAAAQSQRQTREEQQVQAELIRRIRVLSAYLRREAEQANAAGLALSRASSRDTTEIVIAASRQRSKLAQHAARRARTTLIQSEQGPSASSQQQAFVSELAVGTQRLRGYAGQLQSMSSRLARASSKDILAALSATPVPPEVAVAMASPISDSSPLEKDAHRGLQPYIVGPGSSATVDYPAVGVVVAKDSSLGNVPVCTGTLIAPRIVLTAAHCQTFRLVGVFFQHAGLFDLSGPLTPHPEFRFPDADIGVLMLRTAVEGIQPAPLNESGPVITGTSSRIVGFGYRNALSADGQSVPSSSVLKRVGLKLHARVVTDRCDSTSRAARLVCWTFMESGVDGALGSTCHVDSGGPLFIHDGTQWVLAGVTTAGTTCQVGDRAVDAEVFRFLTWVRAQIDRTPAPTSAATGTLRDPLAPVDNPDRFLFASQYGEFDGASSAWTQDFRVSAQARLLRIGLSGTPSESPLRLEVGPKDAPSPACVRSADSTMQSCEVSSPMPGDWTVKVVGLTRGEFQSVATEFKP